MPAEIIVVKIGGSTLGSHDTSLEDVLTLQRQGLWPVVVHGGGQVVTEWLTRCGLETRFVGGLRVTADVASLEVVLAVLAGLVNKEIVAALNEKGGRAVGLSGVDGWLLPACVRDPELGFVGEVERVNGDLLKVLLKAGFLPVIASIGLGRDGSGVVRPLNINADSVAGDIAVALGARRLVFLTDVPGIRDGAGQVVDRITPSEVQAMLQAGIIAGGMIPKVEACLRGLRAGVRAQIVDGRQAHALLGTVGEGLGGTALLAEGKV